MIIKMFTVYDSKTEVYMRPFFALTKGEAMRSFSESCADSHSMFSKHPADFHLFEMGSFDDATALLDPITPLNLGCALEFIPDVAPTYEGMHT